MYISLFWHNAQINSSQENNLPGSTGPGNCHAMNWTSLAGLHGLIWLLPAGRSWPLLPPPPPPSNEGYGNIVKSFVIRCKNCSSNDSAKLFLRCINGRWNSWATEDKRVRVYCLLSIGAAPLGGHIGVIFCPLKIRETLPGPSRQVKVLYCPTKDSQVVEGLLGQACLWTEWTQWTCW